MTELSLSTSITNTEPVLSENVIMKVVTPEKPNILARQAIQVYVPVGGTLSLPVATSTTPGAVSVPRGSGLSVNSKGELSLSSNVFVKTDLSTYTKVLPLQYSTPALRENTSLYLNNSNGKPRTISMEQLKNLNSKILATDDLGNDEVRYLSNNDYLLFKL